MELAEIFGPILAVGIVFAAPVIIVLLVLRHRRALEEMRQKTLLALIERGGTVTPEMLLAPSAGGGGNGDLRAGLFLLCLGLGVIACVLALPDKRLWGLGLVPVFAGLGLLVTWVLLRMRRPRGDA